MKIALNMCFASQSADPAVTFLNRMREKAYSHEASDIREALGIVNPDHVEDLNFVVIGIPSLTSKNPIGFAVEDTVENKVVCSYLLPNYSVNGRGRVTKVLGDTVQMVSVPPAYSRGQILMRLPMDAF